MVPIDNESVHPASLPEGTLRWPLSPVDIYSFRWLIQGTWIFGRDLDPGALKEGLSRLLAAYPILCGRVVGGKAIEYREHGVPLTIESEEERSVDDFAVGLDDVRRFADRRRLRKIRKGREPLMTVRLTKLCDGWIVAICCSHACLDGSGFYTMVQNLGRATAGQPFPPPVLDRPAEYLKTARSKGQVLQSVREAGWHKLSPVGIARYLVSAPHMMDRIFVTRLSTDSLQRCKGDLIRDSKCPRLSTNTAVVAHVAGCLVKLLRLRTNSKFAVSSVIDQRERITALPRAFARNAAAVVSVEDIPASATRGEIAGLIHEGLEQMIARPSPELEKIVSLMKEAAQYRLPYSAISMADMFGRRPSLFYTNSFLKFRIYDLEFAGKSGLMRPLRAVPHNLGDPVLLWPAPPSTGGLELYFSGALARAVGALEDKDPWWDEIRHFDAAG